MTPTIDSKSLASVWIGLYCDGEEISAATGFVVRVGEAAFLVTNYHVISGLHPITNSNLHSAGLRPDRVLVAVHDKASRLMWRPLIQRVVDDRWQPLWVEHPQDGHQFDVVALPLALREGEAISCYELDPGPELAVHVASSVSIVGFPTGTQTAGLTAIWKTGTVASEPDLRVGNEDFFWVDALGHRGMSGSPVVARRTGTSLMANGNIAVGPGIQDRLLGVYAGRSQDSGLALGRVWRWSGVARLLHVAYNRWLLGQLQPVLTTLGRAPKKEAVFMSIIKIKNDKCVVLNLANGQSRAFHPSDLIREVVLMDQRFGQDLDHLREAAKIDAACAATDGHIELTEQQFQLVVAVLQKPSSPYVPAVGRQLLPLIDHVLGAPQTAE